MTQINSQITKIQNRTIKQQKSIKYTHVQLCKNQTVNNKQCFNIKQKFQTKRFKSGKKHMYVRRLVVNVM